MCYMMLHDIIFGNSRLCTLISGTEDCSQFNRRAWVSYVVFRTVTEGSFKAFILRGSLH